MDISLDAALESRLSRLAYQQQRDSRTLIIEAVERLVDHEEWFSKEVDKGIAAADQGKFIEHESVRSLIDSRYKG